LSLYNPTGWFHPFHVRVAGSYAYVEEGGELFLFDVSDEANPVEMESLALPLDSNGITALGPFVYVSDYWAGLQIYENTMLPKNARISVRGH
jgi:hypothetical protein